MIFVYEISFSQNNNSAFFIYSSDHKSDIDYSKPKSKSIFLFQISDSTATYYCWDVCGIDEQFEYYFERVGDELILRDKEGYHELILLLQNDNQVTRLSGIDLPFYENTYFLEKGSDFYLRVDFNKRKWRCFLMKIFKGKARWSTCMNMM
jgi:hypothetical protein